MHEPTSPAAAPAPSLRVSEMETRPSGWNVACQVLLYFTGAVYVLMGLSFTALMTLVGVDDAELGAVGGMVMGVVIFVMGVGFGALNFVAAVGLKKQTKWGWVLAIVLAGIYTPSGCLPIGVILLVGLLQDDVRKACFAD